jgi:hypothetical protein
MKHPVVFLLSWICAFTLVTFVSCTKEGQRNPFDDLPPPPAPDTIVIVHDMSSIAGIHARIFMPTCANSGCHDGTFEPDFRTIESSYNTMVLHPIIKNDPQGSYTYRVVPGDPQASQLMARLTYDIDGQSGIMPLVVDPGAEWHTKSEEFIGYIRDWIQNGARDIQGNTVSPVDAVPAMQGVLGRVNGQNMERAEGGQGALRIPQTVQELELLFSFSDDKTLPSNFGVNEIRFSNGPDDFVGKSPYQLEILNTPIQDRGYFGSQVLYTHRIVINPQNFASLGQTMFFRVYVQDSSNPVTEIPSNPFAYYFKTFFSFTIVE